MRYRRGRKGGSYRLWGLGFLCSLAGNHGLSAGTGLSVAARRIGSERGNDDGFSHSSGPKPSLVGHRHRQPLHVLAHHSHSGMRQCLRDAGQRMRRTARCLMAAIQADQGLFSLRLRTGGRHMRPWAFLVQSCRIILSFHPASRRNDSEIYGRCYGCRTNC
jgi:hypothetical protein